MPDWLRTLSVYIDVPEEWLVGDWDVAAVESGKGWDDLKEDVQTALDRYFQGTYARMRPKFDVDWACDPETKE